ncbi:hypothetical protein RHSIM_Rhsim11G0050900 [Rhododendron simsii]|uniref:Hydroxyproline-rich glycoprotein family protein n=1 Tax=Rhododendron simsii TaxID=118357 RepID=A0A834G8N7_RHOSS|nr:hypothetical protein RHSIM_Rhsim11G0050900 [Rhododendron simsii]
MPHRVWRGIVAKVKLAREVASEVVGSWELVQLLLVGIAVSYGLFSRRNDETEKEHSSTFDNAQSYVSRLLQVSSVFDDDSESPSVSDENKVQTWSSQYFRGEPVVGVAQQNSVIDEKQSGSASRVVVDKPLLLPIRSLKSRVMQPDFSETANESSGKGGSLSKSSLNSGSKSFSSNSNKTRTGEVGGPIPLDTEQLKAEENVVLRSPIPWRSRSGRMEMKEETDDDGVPLYSLPPSIEESDFNRLRSQSKPSPMSISSLKNTFSSQSSPPPAPPLPPPLYVRKPPLVKSNSTLSNPEDFPVRELKRSAWTVTKELINGAETGEMQNRAYSGAESRPRVPSDGGSLMGKSVQTSRLGEPIQKGIPKTGFVDYEWEEKKQEFEENVAVETDEESEGEDQDLFDGGSENDNENENENEEVVSNNVGDVGKDVNKKADEFIAKFREQIRLQRIESIKRSTGLIAKSSSR